MKAEGAARAFAPEPATTAWPRRFFLLCLKPCRHLPTEIDLPVVFSALGPGGIFLHERESVEGMAWFFCLIAIAFRFWRVFLSAVGSVFAGAESWSGLRRQGLKTGNDYGDKAWALFVVSEEKRRFVLIEYHG